MGNQTYDERIAMVLVEKGLNQAKRIIPSLEWGIFVSWVVFTATDFSRLAMILMAFYQQRKF